MPSFADFNTRAFTVSLTGLLCAICVILLNIRLLWRFRTSYMRNKPEYQLFTIRFTVDVCFSIAVSFYYTGLIVSYIDYFTLFHYHWLFYITLLSSNFLSTRFFLALLISLERLFAVFFPIKFYNNRRRIPIFLIFTVIFAWGGFEDVMYFSICDISPFEKNCSILACTWNECFLGFWTGSKLLIGAFSCVSSLILFVKLCAFRRAINQHFSSSDVSKTNYLCLVDAALTIIFDFSPFLFTLLFKTQLLSADIYGPYNATAKSLACLIDAVIATFVLKISHRTPKTTVKNVTTVNPKSQGSRSSRTVH